MDKLNAQEDPASADMDALAKEVDENLSASAKTFGSDDTTLDDKLKEAVKSLTDGQVAPEVIEGESAYYVARMDATFDETSTQTKKRASSQSANRRPTTNSWKIGAKTPK